MFSTILALALTAQVQPLPKRAPVQWVRVQRWQNGKVVWVRRRVTQGYCGNWQDMERDWNDQLRDARDQQRDYKDFERDLRDQRRELRRR